MTIKDIRKLDILENYEDDWNKLIKKCPDSVHTQTFAWLYSFFRYKLLDGEKWICLFAYNNSELFAVYPLIISRRIGLPGLYLQSFRTPYDVYHTIRVDGLILPGYEFILEHFINHLKRSFKAMPIIMIRRIPEFSPSMIFFRNKKVKLDYFKMYVGAENFIHLTDNHQIFLSGLNSKFRRDIDRQLRRLNNTAGVSFRFRESNRTNEENLEIFKELENSGWKGEKKTSIKRRPGDSELFLFATNKLKEKGWILWNFLEVNNVKIAAQLHAKINNITVLWKICYREDYSYLSPGKILVYKCIEDFYNHRELGEKNFMCVNKWFKDWNVSERPLYTLFIFPKKIFISTLLKLLLKIKFS